MSALPVEQLRDRQAACFDLGFRRVERVQVTVAHGPVVAEVTGVAHRYPLTRRVPLAAAVRLAEAGVPLHIVERTGR